MTNTNNILPDWISRQVSLSSGQIIDLDGERTDENEFWYFLSVCCPMLFDSYAIILNPFWINWKVKELMETGLAISEKQIEESDFKRLDWRQFFKIYNKNFDLKTANQTKIEIKKQILLNEWPPYLWFPGGENCETEELKFILNQLEYLYGDTLVNYFYCLLKTEKWENEIIYRGQISEFDELKSISDIRENPTAIYLDTKEWCIVSDYDLPFSYIGGTKEFIDRITNNNDFDIYRIEPKFKEKTNDNTCR